MSTKRMEQYKGIKEGLLVLIENADLVVIDKVVVKSRDKNPYIYEGSRICDDDKMYINISRYNISSEIISVKIKCQKRYYIENDIATLINSIITNNDYVVNLTIV